MMMKVVVIVERVIRTPIDSGDDFGDPSEDTDEMMSKMKIDKSWKQEIFVNNLFMYKDMIPLIIIILLLIIVTVSEKT